MKHPYIHLILCDNDYGQHLEKAARLLLEALGTNDILVSEDRIKRLVVKLVLALEDLSAAARGFDATKEPSYSYLMTRLEVKFGSAPLDLDHDGGSVSIHRPNNYIWRF